MHTLMRFALTPAWPRNLRTTSPDATSHSTTALSPPPEQRLLLSKELGCRRVGQRPLAIPASALPSRPGLRLTRPRPAPRSRGRCRYGAASPAAGSTASGSCRCRTSGSNCHPLGNKRGGAGPLASGGGRRRMKMRALTVKPHGSYCPLPAVQRLQQFSRQLGAPRLWLRESHSSRLSFSPPYSNQSATRMSSLCV